MKKVDMEAIYKRYMAGESIDALAQEMGHENALRRCLALIRVTEWAATALDDREYVALTKRMMPGLIDDIAFALMV